MHAGIVLVHGYTGTPENLAPLARALVAVYGTDAVRIVCLPGHKGDTVPIFDEQSFTASVNDAVNTYRKEGRACIVLGHSTGGVIARAALAESGITPELLILASAPRRIDTAYLDRWSRHRFDKTEILFASVANMVSFINATGARTLQGTFPVLVLQGAEDELVPAAETHLWEQGAFSGRVRTALIPLAGHDLFRGPNSALAIDAAMRAVSDAVHRPSGETMEAIGRICAVEPEAGRFLDRAPYSTRHIAESPSGRTTAGLAPLLSPHVQNEPTIANVEITTRCNLSCPFCARTLRGIRGEDMSKDMFATILGLLPHA